MSLRIQKHMRNFCFLLLTFATGLFYFCFYFVGITLGVSMAFTLVGLPILYYVLRSTSVFVQYERSQTKVYTDTGAALIWIGPYLGNGLVKMIGGYTRRMVESLAGK